MELGEGIAVTADLKWAKGYSTACNLIWAQQHKLGGRVSHPRADPQGLAGHWSACGGCWYDVGVYIVLERPILSSVGRYHGF